MVLRVNMGYNRAMNLFRKWLIGLLIEALNRANPPINSKRPKRLSKKIKGKSIINSPSKLKREQKEKDMLLDE